MRRCGMQNGIAAAGRFARTLAVMAMLSVMAIGLTACTSSTSYRLSSESLLLKAESDAYVAHGNKIDAAITAGRATADQAARFAKLTADVRAADDLVQADLATWRATGVEPVTYVKNADALRWAQVRVAALAAEVK